MAYETGISSKQLAAGRKRVIAGALLSAAVIVLGVVATAVRIQIENDPWIIYRWLTVAGNMFAILVCVPVCISSCIALARRKESSSRVLYYLQLTAATTEVIVIIASVLAYLPIIPQDGAEGTADMVIMHFVTPVLMIALFVFCAQRPTRLPRYASLWGLAFLALYSAGLVINILTGLLPARLIPYFFLDFGSQPAWIPLLFAILVFGLAYLFSWVLAKANAKFSR